MADTKTVESRVNRELDSRAKDERPRSWAPPTLLPDPAPEAGYTYRWIRVSTLGQADPRNVSSKIREGWEPVRAEDHPEISMYLDNDNARFKDNVVVGAYYQQQAEAQIRSVDNHFMRENDPRMPLFSERKTTVSFGRSNQQS